MTSFHRRSGIFLHPTALPGPYGIGSLGEDAESFIETLASAEQSLWQLCPLGPTVSEYDHSPYKTLSAFAGNPLLIDLDRLEARGLLDKSDLTDREFPDDHVDFDAVEGHKQRALQTAFDRFEPATHTEIRDRIDSLSASTEWFDEYTVFRALRSEFDGKPVWEWPEPARTRESAALEEYRTELAEEIQYRAFVQAVFYEQWQRIRAYANERGVEIIGDIPIYVAADSADAWANPEIFQLTEGKPTVVSGIEATEEHPGQKWGHPVYDWNDLESQGYDWWIRRFEWCYELADIARIDHFIGFDRYYTIPADEPPAAGEFHPGPGREFFETLLDRIDSVRVIAEDIGPARPQVDELRAMIDAPGLCVPQYADWCATEDPDRPEDCERDRIIYPSNHDTNTVRGYYDELEADQRACLDERLGTSADTVHWDLIEAAWESEAVLAVTMLQDLFGLGSESRFNTPGTVGDNWSWRCRAAQLDSIPTDRLAELTGRTDRSREHTPTDLNGSGVSS